MSTHAYAAETLSQRSPSEVHQLTQHPPRSAAAFQQLCGLAQSTTAQAHKDEAIRRREPHRASLSTAREAQSMRSIGSEQRLLTLHSLVMCAPLKLLRLRLAPHEHGGTAAPEDDERASLVPSRSRWSPGRAARRRRELAARPGRQAWLGRLRQQRSAPWTSTFLFRSVCERQRAWRRVGRAPLSLGKRRVTGGTSMSIVIRH